MNECTDPGVDPQDEPIGPAAAGDAVDVRLEASLVEEPEVVIACFLLLGTADPFGRLWTRRAGATERFHANPDSTKSVPVCPAAVGTVAEAALTRAVLRGATDG